MGRRGPYSRREWALAGAHAVSFTKEMHNQSPLSIVITSSETVPLNEPFSVTVAIKKNKDINQDITCQVFHSAGMTVRGITRWDVPADIEKELIKNLSMEVIYPNIRRLGRHYVAVRAEWLEVKKKKSYSTMCYFSIEGYEHLAPVDNEQEMTAGQDSHGLVITHDAPRIKAELMQGTTGTAGER